MKKTNRFGFLRLAKQTLSVVTASFTALLGNQSKATPVAFNFEDANKNLNYDSFQKRILKPKLVLKLNVANPGNSLLIMHTSHRSHSSHSSHSSYTPSPGHSSHASHTSHVSSSPSYTPSIQPTYTVSTSPTYTPSTTEYTVSTVPEYTPATIPENTPSTTPPPVTKKNKTTNTIKSIKKTKTTKIIVETKKENFASHHPLGTRILYRYLEGTDVKEVQKMLFKLGYDVLLSGVFDGKTQEAVKKFQKANKIAVDGKVNKKTLDLLIEKSK